MGKFRFLCPLVALSLISAMSLSCGSNSGLKSVTVTPAAADAQNFPNGQVQFTAMGTFSGSMQSGPVKALWWNSQPWVIVPTPANGITIDGNTGLATCTNLIGTFQVWATAPKNQSMDLSQMSKGTAQVTATAQMTCP